MFQKEKKQSQRGCSQHLLSESMLWFSYKFVLCRKAGDACAWKLSENKDGYTLFCQVEVQYLKESKHSRVQQDDIYEYLFLLPYLLKCNWLWLYISTKCLQFTWSVGNGETDIRFPAWNIIPVCHWRRISPNKPKKWNYLLDTTRRWVRKYVIYLFICNLGNTAL